MRHALYTCELEYVYSLPVPPSLYVGLGFAWGTSLLAFVAVVVGIPVLVGLRAFGEKL